ncbi:MAG: hypothetical protein ACUVV0_00615 [Anaerolineae bacterium]
MATMGYKELLSRVRQLDLIEQLRLLEELVASVRRRLTTRPRRNIMELQGLGKEIWQGIDAQEYVRQERASWDG